MGLYRNLFKRIIDLSIALIGFVILFPLFLLIILVLLIANKGAPLFFQERPGKYGRIFKVIKFKTMTDGRNSVGEYLPDSERLTIIGKFIRRTSLDEIPQLLNVIKGDMSLVGPRPLLVEYMPLYSEEQSHRHDVRPGITGWAQINGRNAINWQEKFKYDIWYVNNLSFLLDCRIVWRTVAKVLQSEGISQVGNATMEKFTGNSI